MTSSADANSPENMPQDDKAPEAKVAGAEKRSEPRRRRSESKKAEISARSNELKSDEPKFDEPKFDAAKFDAVGSDESKAEPRPNFTSEFKPEPKSEKPEAQRAESRAGSEGDEARKALATAGASPVNPFLAAKAEDKVDAPLPPRSFASRMLDYSAHVAIIVGLVGFAWTVSGYVINRPAKTGDTVTAAKSGSPAKLDEMGELRLANIKMHEEIKALKASVDSMRTAARRDTTSEQVRMLSAGLDNVKNSLGASKSETSNAIAQLQGKIDKLGGGKIQALTDRVGRLEHQGVDIASTGSIARNESSRSDSSAPEPSRSEPSRFGSSRSDAPRTESSKPAPSESAKIPPKPPAKPASLANLEDNDRSAQDDGKPSVISGWVVRDVYQGVALIEGKKGTLEVVPGVSIPGAGVVKSIDRKGGGWVVTTSKGQLAYAGGAAQREQRNTYRRGGNGYGGNHGRDGYSPYRYDY